MQVYQRILRVLSIILIVWSCAVIAGGVVSVAFPDIVAPLASDVLIRADVITSEEDISIVVLSIGIILIFAGLITLIEGQLGLRGAKNPHRIMPFLVVTAFLIVFETVNLIQNFIGGADNLLAIGVSLFTFSFALVCLYCAIVLRRAAKNGETDFLPEKEPKRAPLGPVLMTIQVLFMINVLLALGSLTMLIKGNYELGFGQILSMANLVFDGVCFWLIFLRTKAARYWTCGFSLFNIVAGIIYNVATNDFSFDGQFVASFFDIFLFLYFAFAKKPKEALTKGFEMALVHDDDDDRIEGWGLWQLKTWPFWRNMIMFYFVFSIMGHWMEAGFCLLIKYGILPGIYDPTSQIWSDWLYPFPVYGVGMVACAVVLYPVKMKLQEKLSGAWKPLVCSFVINALVCTLIELVLGLTSNMPDANGVYPLWDYSDMFCNFMGQVCLQNAIAFGVASTLITWVVFPALQRLLLRLPKDMGNAIFVAVVIFGMITVCLYLVNVAV